MQTFKISLTKTSNFKLVKCLALASVLALGLAACSSDHTQYGSSDGSLDMSTLKCQDKYLNSATTLTDVQNDCLVKKQQSSKGRYEVVFVNSTTNKTVVCYFASNSPTAELNSCH